MKRFIGSTTNVTNNTYVDTKPIERGLDNISNSVNRLSDTISADSIELSNDRYTELLNKETLYIKLRQDILVYFSYVTLCMGGERNYDLEDTVTHESRITKFYMSPTDQNKLSDLDIYVEIDLIEKTLTLCETDAGPFEFQTVDFIEKSAGTTTVIKERYERFMEVEKYLPLYLELADEIESVTFNVFEDLINYTKKGLQNMTTQRFLIGGGNEGFNNYRNIISEAFSKGEINRNWDYVFKFDKRITQFCIDLSVDKDICYLNMYQGRGIFLDYFGLDGSKEIKKGWRGTKMLEIGITYVRYFGEVNSFKLPVFVEVSIVSEKRDVHFL